jgi:alpha-galactosidase
VNGSRPTFRVAEVTFEAAGISLGNLQPLIDGEPLDCEAPRVERSTITWPARDRTFVLRIAADEQGLRLEVSLEGVPDLAVDSIGLRIGTVANVLRYLRNGYTSWDGSYFVEEEGNLVGHAMTALVARSGGTAVLGFLRHDRFQSRLRFAMTEGSLAIDIETLIDQVPHSDRVAAETLVLLAGDTVEETLRRWARQVAAASDKPPRIRAKRISGWCSWYNLYASISEATILEHLRAAANFRDRFQAPLEVFQIDDGFTPEMGDWLDLKPQFPRGMAPLLDDIRKAGFVPGLWIAPLMVGNRSRLYAEHPDWVVKERASGMPIAPMTFYGEFRWHKRSEEYYILDITHPAAESYIRGIFRTWRREWGCAYFKTDFMHFGCEHGPKQARRHQEGLSRMEIWMRMVRLIREEIGDATWLASGSPIWAPIGWVDAVRIGRDIGVAWKGHYSAESLLRDQTARNFANGIFWQADPDCILLRERFHNLTNDEVDSLAMFAGLAGGVLMTSDQLEEISPERGRLFAELARAADVQPCEFPELGEGPVLVQRVPQKDGTVLINVFNTGDEPAEKLVAGVQVSLRPHASRRVSVSSRA